MELTNTYTIYSLNCPINKDVVRYIGVTRRPNKRFRAHLIDKDRTYKTSWIKSLKEKSLVPHFNIIEDGLPEKEAFKKEIEYIKLFKSCGAKLTNATIGGEGITGYKLTPEHKEKLRIAHTGLSNNRKGIKLSEETKAKISRTLTGRTISQETIRKRREKMKGVKRQPFSIERRIQMSISRKGKKTKPLSEEHKLKISLAKKGCVCRTKGLKNIYSPETIKRMSEARKGMKFTEQHRINIGLAKKGKKREPLSEEHKLKMSLSKKGCISHTKGLKNIYSLETLKKMSDAKKGKKLSEQHRINIGLAKKGKKRKPFSEEHKLKMSITKRNIFMAKKLALNNSTD